MHRDTKIAIIIIGLSVLCVCFACRLPSIRSDYERRRAIENLAQIHGLESEDIATYEKGLFPVNYIEHALGWAWDQPEHPTIYRRDVESVVKGYVSRCDWMDTSTLYLFYSDWLSPKTIFHGEALVMEVSYQWDVTREGMRDDQVVQSIGVYFLSDSGGLPWEGIAPHCKPPARYAACEFRLPIIGCGIER
jgi:hypothetical protein